MHDATGRQLKVGDRVVILAVVKELSPIEEYCNVSAESILGRRPDGMKETFGAINTGVLIRVSEHDEETS